MLYRLIRSFTTAHPRFWGIVRVFLYLFVVTNVLLVIAARSAWADAERAVQNAGLGLINQLGPMLIGPPQPIVINGQRLFFASKQTTLGVGEVLNRFERHCEENSGGLGEELGKLPAEFKLSERLRDPSRWAIVRGEARDGAAGQLGCIAQRGKGGLRVAIERLIAFTESGDLGKLGDMRYVTARKNDNGKSHVLAVWSEGSFNIGAMFKADGDVPGRDSEHVPRPPDARRVLSAEVPDRPYGVRMYDTTHSRPEVFAFYDHELAARGFQARPVGPKGDPHGLKQEFRAFTKDGNAVLIATDTLKGNKTGVTLIEMGSFGAAHAFAIRR